MLTMILALARQSLPVYSKNSDFEIVENDSILHDSCLSNKLACEESVKSSPSNWVYFLRFHWAKVPHSWRNTVTAMTISLDSNRDKDKLNREHTVCASDYTYRDKQKPRNAFKHCFVISGCKALCDHNLSANFPFFTKTIFGFKD